VVTELAVTAVINAEILKLLSCFLLELYFVVFVVVATAVVVVAVLVLVIVVIVVTI
jgi:hypothetical protein